MPEIGTQTLLFGNIMRKEAQNNTVTARKISGRKDRGRCRKINLYDPTEWRRVRGT